MAERRRIGTPDWLVETGGRLTRTEAGALAVRSTLGLVAPRPGRALDEATADRRFAAATRAWDEVLGTVEGRTLDEALPPTLRQHSARSLVAGTLLLDESDYTRVDLHAAAYAALAHDLGLLVPPGRAGDACFTVASIAALEAAARTGSEPARELDDARLRAAEWAVAAHFQPRPPADSPPEARLLAYGTAADVVGTGRRRIPARVRAQIAHGYPDDAFGQDFNRHLAAEARRAPRTRAAVLRACGMPVLVRLAGRWTP